MFQIPNTSLFTEGRRVWKHGFRDSGDVVLPVSLPSALGCKVRPPARRYSLLCCQHCSAGMGRLETSSQCSLEAGHVRGCLYSHSPHLHSHMGIPDPGQRGLICSQEQ